MSYNDVLVAVYTGAPKAFKIILGPQNNIHSQHERPKMPETTSYNNVPKSMYRHHGPLKSYLDKKTG